jgi:tRNA (guanine37-N1)-methyltransferase
MKIDVLTLFPKMFESPFEESIINRAIKNKIIELNIHNLRDWAIDSYGTVDDKPFGGDVGMLIRVDVVYEALKQISNFEFLISNKNKGQKLKKQKIVLMSARGRRFDQEKAEELAKLDNLIIISGHYEGFDQRIIDFMVDEEISIGDYVLTGGELPAMVVIDTVSRLVKGVLGKDESNKVESWSEIEIDGKKIRTEEYPQYTRPREFMGKGVPDVLLSGDPKKIKNWQTEQIKQQLEKRNGQ